MKIIIHSLTYLPKVGGLENIMSCLAYEWSKEHQLTVFTSVPEGDSSVAETINYRIKRRANLFELFKNVKNADVFVEANISLKTFWIGLLNRRKWIVVHHLPYTHASGWKAKFKNFLTKFSHNVSVSNYLATTLKGQSVVINNPYNDIFKNINTTEARDGFVFLGRLVSDKGVDLLIDAFKIIVNDGLHYNLSIIGDGPDKSALQAKVEAYGLKDRIKFLGVLRGLDLVKELNVYKSIIIPSKWPEPYGIVALEGLACGCSLVYSNQGGLPEAANNFGFQFENGDVNGLVEAIKKSERESASFKNQANEVKSYLVSKQQSSIAEQYIQLFIKKINKA